MKARGREAKLPQETINKMVDEYLTTDKKAQDIADKYGVSAEVVRYHTRKRRKETEA